MSGSPTGNCWRRAGAARSRSTIAYYDDHRAGMDRMIEEHRRHAEEMRAPIEREQGPSPAQKKLKAMKRGA